MKLEIKARAPWSIATRLTLLYFGLSLGLMALACAFLFNALTSSLDREDSQSLSDRMDVMRAISARKGDSLGELRREAGWEGAKVEKQGVMMRVMDSAGKVLSESPGMAKALPPEVFPSLAPIWDRAGPGAELQGADGKSYWVLAAWATSGDGNDRQIQLAEDRSEESEIIAAYRARTLIVLVVWAISSAVLGYAITHSAVYPVKQMAELAAGVRPANLSRRIETEGWPSEVRTLAITINQMLERLEDSFSRLSRFSADLAHELRTPLSNLRGEAEVALAQSRTPDEYRAVIESSLEEYARVSRIIDGLLFVARAETPGVTIYKSEFDGREELETVCDFHEAQAQELEIQLICYGRETLVANPELFRRAVSNILSNALRYTGPGGEVTLSLTRTEAGVLVSARDTGSGIRAEDLPHIFDRLYRADSSRSAYPEGSGLGLSIVKSIMEMHGGTVRVASDGVSGTTITLFFPM